MSILDNLKRFVQPYSDEEDYEEYDDEEVEDEDEEVVESAPRGRRPSPFANTSNAGNSSRSASTGNPDTSNATASSNANNFNGQVLNINTNNHEVVLFHAKSFSDAAKAADELRKKKAVILNMENVDKALTRRVVDFLSGSVYALEGKVKKVAQATYLFCPHNMTVSGDLENVQTEIDSYI